MIPLPTLVPGMARNRLLAMLPWVELQSLAPELEAVVLPAGKCLYDSGSPLQHAYFPAGGVIALVYRASWGASAELALVGCEGMLGVALFMGGETTPDRAVVRTECPAYRLPAQVLKARFAAGGMFQRTLLRYTEALITQVSMIAVCNLHHCVEQQLCRWLLQSLDRTPANELRATQLEVAGMLGVRRQAIVEAARRLELCRLISHARGSIVVLDREGILARACECYTVVKKETDRLLPQRPAAAPAVRLLQPSPPAVPGDGIGPPARSMRAGATAVRSHASPRHSTRKPAFPGPGGRAR